MYELQYIPLALPFFLFFVGLFIFLVVLIQLHVLQFAYAKLGLSSGAALLVLLASLIGSYFNIPLAELPEREVRSGQVIEFFGMRYIVPLVTDWPRTVIAVNIGGAVIPTLLSLYLLIKNDILSSAAVATAVVMVACYLLAQPVPGVGIAIPSLVPPIIAATTALLVAQRNVAAVAYVSGSLGTLIGADLLNLGRIQGLGAPVMSIPGGGFWATVDIKARRQIQLRRCLISIRHPTTNSSDSGSPPSSFRRRFRKASSFWAFTSAAEVRGFVRSIRRV
jgi:uncharacterized membrane protein